EAQRRQALRQADGALMKTAEGWRARLLRARAMLEAELDFSDEEDAQGAAAGVAAEAEAERAETAAPLAGGTRGERLREGFAVVLAGPPNAGKSTLLNTLARRDVAIVTDVPGTTRDVLEVFLDIEGLPVTLIDTAGLREAAEIVEAEGVRRALTRAASADLVLWLTEGGTPPPANLAGAGAA